MEFGTDDGNGKKSESGVSNNRDVSMKSGSKSSMVVDSSIKSPKKREKKNDSKSRDEKMSSNDASMKYLNKSDSKSSQEEKKENSRSRKATKNSYSNQRKIVKRVEEDKYENEDNDMASDNQSFINLSSIVLSNSMKNSEYYNKRDDIANSAVVTLNYIEENSDELRAMKETYMVKKIGVIEEKMVINSLKELQKPELLEFNLIENAKVIRKIFGDFLYKFKDRYPFSNPKMKGPMDNFTLVMNSLLSLGLLPSESLFKEYESSNFNKELNKFPSLAELNKEFGSAKMDKDTYDNMKKAYDSFDPFVYFFNPDTKLDIHVIGGAMYKKGYFTDNKSDIGIGMHINRFGFMHNGYYKDGKIHNFGRYSSSLGIVYEGGWNMNKKHGEGKEFNIWFGKLKTGQWVNDKKQGDFKIEFEDRTKKMVKYRDDQEVDN